MGTGVGRKEGRPPGGANSAAKDGTWCITKAEQRTKEQGLRACGHDQPHLRADWRNARGGEGRGQSPLAEGSVCSLVSPVWPSTGRAPREEGPAGAD